MGHAIANWFWWFTGGRDEAGRAYGLWSGFGGAIPDFLILGGLITFYRQHNCAHRPCRRMGKMTTANGLRLCHPHSEMPPDQLDLPQVHPGHQ